jgi:hypothetical protein
MAIYRCFKYDFDNLEKRIKRITNKLDKYNKHWEFKVLGESVEEVNVYDYTDKYEPKNMGKRAVEVVSYSFDMDTLQLGDYKVIAVLEHNATLEQNENVIHILDESVTIPQKYRTTKSICEHCHIDRARNKTVLLQDENGDFKQVGTTCLQEYTGIDASDIVSIYDDIHDIVLDYNDRDVDYAGVNSLPIYVKTLDYLTACIQLIHEKGYKKEEDNEIATKYEAMEIVLLNRQKKEYEELAKQVIDYFRNKTFIESDNFLENIKVYMNAEYTKYNGFVAYSYLAYKKQLEIDGKKKAEQEINELSEYQGNIGDRLEKELTLDKCFSYEIDSYSGYGTQTQYIYLFRDDKGNIYKWKTGNSLFNKDTLKCYESGDKLKLKGSIKGHDEYKGVKQTELTRCRLVV